MTKNPKETSSMAPQALISFHIYHYYPLVTMNGNCKNVSFSTFLSKLGVDSLFSEVLVVESLKFFFFLWQSLAELREEESLLLKERRNLKNVSPCFLPWLLVLRYLMGDT